MAVEGQHMRGWVGVDLDGTLAHYDGWKGSSTIGDPIPRMVSRVKRWLAEGRDVRIFTARVALENPEERIWVISAIQWWCREHIGQVLPITCVKDMAMIELWDDRAVEVVKNTGRVANPLHRTEEDE